MLHNYIFRRFSKNDLMGTVIMPLKDADLYGMLMRRPVDQRKGLLKVSISYYIPRPRPQERKLYRDGHGT